WDVVALLDVSCCRWVSPVVEFFFFSSRRRHTRLVSDWSSDVCSSDLNVSVGSLSLGWFTSLSADDVVIQDKKGNTLAQIPRVTRSEERRVGKECRSRWWQ